jgi:hypothetical protein
MFQLQLFFLLHCDEWDRVVALPIHKFVKGATLLQLVYLFSKYAKARAHSPCLFCQYLQTEVKGITNAHTR